MQMLIQSISSAVSPTYLTTLNYCMAYADWGFFNTFIELTCFITLRNIFRILTSLLITNYTHGYSWLILKSTELTNFLNLLKYFVTSWFLLAHWLIFHWFTRFKLKSFLHHSTFWIKYLHITMSWFKSHYQVEIKPS